MHTVPIAPTHRPVSPWRTSVAAGRTAGYNPYLIQSDVMRRILVILMFSLLPFQVVWGAAASYCQHEQGAGTGHFGHHIHKHQGKMLKASGESTPDKKNIAGADDPDCASCHLTCVTLVMHTAVWLSSEPGAPLRAAPNSEQPQYIPNTIDRPNWALAA